mgnify:CR=1 FL=1
MPAAQRRQKNTKMLVVTKNSQPQGPSGEEVLASATKCKNQPGALVGMPWQGFGRQGECSKSGGLPSGCHLDLCIFLGWAAFHGNFLLWAASMPPCQCACPQSWVRPKVCSLDWLFHPKTAPKSKFWPLVHGPGNGKFRCHCS